MSEIKRIQGMVRSIDQWRNMVPSVVVTGSMAQVEYALADAKTDIEALWLKVAALSSAAVAEREPVYDESEFLTIAYMRGAMDAKRDAASELEAKLAENVSSASMLSNLLARIHRDGGHYEVEHGTEKACADADDIVARLYATPPAPKVTEAMVRMTVSETIRAMGANPDEQLIGELTVFDAVAAKVRAALQEGKE